MRVNYILIDYENVQPTVLNLLNEQNFKVLIFIGSNQTKINIDLAIALQAMGERAEYIKIDGTGSNALDFHIAFHIGRISEKDTNAYFHIISKDTGFDPLIRHLKSRKIYAIRSKEISDIPVIKVSNAKTVEEKISAIIMNLRERGNARPRTLVTLSNSINSLFMKQVDSEEISSLVGELQRRDFICVTENKVSYTLPEP